MTDRNVQFPSRYQLVPVTGTTDTFDFVPVPGTVTAEGDALAKATILPDATVALLEAALGVTLPDDPVIKDVFDALAKTPARIETFSYVGTGVYGSGNENSVTLSNTPALMFIFEASASNIYRFAIFSPSMGGVCLVIALASTYPNTTCPYQYTTTIAATTTWYTTQNAQLQLNFSGVTYYGVAIIPGTA